MTTVGGPRIANERLPILASGQWDGSADELIRGLAGDLLDAQKEIAGQKADLLAAETVRVALDEDRMVDLARVVVAEARVATLDGEMQDLAHENRKIVERAEADIAALTAEMERYKEMVDRADRFRFPSPGGAAYDVFAVRRGDEWCVFDGMNVLCADGSWEWEPQPSSRTEEFRARTRFTRDEAFEKAAALYAPRPAVK